MQTPSSNLVDCLATIRPLIDKHGWQLLDEAEFVHQLQARATATDAENLTKLAVNLYCETWHAACNSVGPRRQRAFTELAHYLYDQALHKYHDRDVAHEIAQDAILLVHAQLTNCQSPGAFMAFALLKLWNAATTFFRRRDRQAQHVADLVTEGNEESNAELVDKLTLAPDIAALNREFTLALTVRIGELLQSTPRAEKQFKAVIFKFLDGYSDEEIAEALETDIASVHVLRSRGMKRLREDAQLRQLAEGLDYLK